MKTKKKVIFIVLRKGWEKRKTAELEKWELRDLSNPKWPKDLKTFLVFNSRRTAMRWVNYWNNGKKLFDVIAVPLNISPIGKLVI